MRQLLRSVFGQLPNVITFGNLLCGVTAIMLATERHFAMAATAIFSAGLLDVLDGAIARRMRGVDAFGEALDSLADIISFGVAPALALYEAFLHPWPFLGWVVAGGFVVCGAWRLARFALVARAPYFQGLPITMAGMSVTSLLFYRDFWSPRMAALVTLGLAVLMISHVHFPKIPSITRRLPRPARFLCLGVLVSAALVFPFTAIIVAIGAGYFVVSFLDQVHFWEAVADGPVGDAFERLRARL